MNEEIRKTVEVNRGFEETFDKYLKETKIKFQDCVLSNGDKFWEITLNNETLLQEISQLSYIYRIEDIMFFYPS